MERLTLGALVAWLLLSGLYAGAQPSLGGDLWWSLAAGRHIVETQTVPDVDVFTYTAAGSPWHNQEWLAQVLYWTLFDHLGPDGLIYTKLLFGLIFSSLFAWLCARRSQAPWWGIATASVVLLVWGHHVDLRAQFFTFLCTVLLLLLLDAFRRGSRLAGIAMPALLLIWVDLHYGFIFGLALIFGTLVVETTKALGGLPALPISPRRCRTLGWVLLASVAACTLNPQGIEALLFPFEILDTSSPWKKIIEWRPPRLFRQGPWDSFALLVLVQAAAAATAAWRKPRHFDLTDFALTVATAAMAFRSRRFIPLFAIVGAPFLASNLAILLSDARQRLPSLDHFAKRHGALATGLMAGVMSLAVANALWAQGHLTATHLFDRMTYQNRFPGDAVEFLSTNGISGRVYNFYPWGGYLSFHLRQPIHVDGRAHAVFPDSVYFERQQIENLEPRWARRLASRKPAIVVHFSSEALPLKLRGQPGWARIYDDGTASVLLRRSPENQEILDAFESGSLSYPDSAGAQLFLAELVSRAGERDAAIASMVDTLTRWPEAGEAALVRKLFVENAAGEFIPDPRASGSAEALATALEIWQRQSGSEDP